LAQVLADEPGDFALRKKGGQCHEDLGVNLLTLFLVRSEQLEQLALFHERRETRHHRQVLPAASAGSSR
jgi:hypothetical protein